MREELGLPISEVSRITKTPCHTLRFWEKEFAGMLLPLRTKGGQRRYTRETVLLIEQIRRLQEEGMSLSRIKRTLSGEQEITKPHQDRVGELAERVSAIVKDEIYNFFRGGYHE